MVGLITGGFGFGNIIVQGFLEIGEIGPAMSLSAGSILTLGLGSDLLIVQGYGSIESAPESEAVVGNIITQGFGFGNIIIQGYSTNSEEITDNGVIRGATSDPYTHNGNAVILSGKSRYQSLEKASDGFGFSNLIGQFDKYRLYQLRLTPDGST